MTGGPIIVHSLEQARTAIAAAAELGLPLTLASAPGAAGYAGPGWFGELVTTVASEVPIVAVTAILDCGAAPGDVLAAIRWSAAEGRVKPILCFTGTDEAAKKLAEMAQAAGMTLIREREAALDLGSEKNPPAACLRWLRGV